MSPSERMQKACEALIAANEISITPETHAQFTAAKQAALAEMRAALSEMKAQSAPASEPAAPQTLADAHSRRIETLLRENAGLREQLEACKDAIHHVLNALADDPRKYWLMGPLTGSYEKLTAAASRLWGKTQDEVKEIYRPANEPWNQYCVQKDADEKLVTLLRERGITAEVAEAIPQYMLDEARMRADDLALERARGNTEVAS